MRLGELNAEKFECLIFVCGFQSPADTEYRLRLLKSTDKDANAMLEDLILEYRRLNNVNLDNKVVENSNAIETIGVAAVPDKPKRFECKEEPNKRFKYPAGC